MSRTRQDYRSLPPGSLEHYLVHVYPSPRKLPYTLETLSDWRIHECGRDKFGNWSNLDARGYPDLARHFIADLDGVPWQRFRDAIEEIRTWDSCNPSGAALVRVLEWYQDAPINLKKGYTALRLAEDLGTDFTNLGRWRKEAVRLVALLVGRTLRE